jgi:tetratricopeptide (TPR) repeat protein
MTFASYTAPAIVLAGLLFGNSAQPGAQPDHAHDPGVAIPREILERPIATRSGIGTVTDPVTTSSREAQAFYNQGMACLHSFAWIDAARSFHQALRLDSRIAMAQLGLSYAYSGLNAAAEARASLERARGLAAGTSRREQRRIRIREKELEAAATPGSAASRTAYLREIDAALEIDPQDVEVWLVRGRAAEGADAVRFYERALGVVPDDFAAHHYLVHANEDLGRIDAALLHAKAYLRLAPSVPHAHHMYGHDLRRAGRTDEAIAEFRAAYDLERQAADAENIPAQYNWHHQHNLDLLATSYQYVGQMTLAAEFLRKSFDLAPVDIVEAVNKRAWPRLLLLTNRSAEALDDARRLTTHPLGVVRAAGHVAAGHVHLAAGRLQAVADEANAALKELRQAGAAARLVAPYLEALQGDFFLRTGQRERGRTMLRAVVRALRESPGPDAWSFALFELEAIARGSREAGDWEFAREAADQMREHDPSYGGTHYALGLVAEHFGQIEPARSAFSRATEAWKHADADFRPLVDARAHLAALGPGQE